MKISMITDPDIDQLVIKILRDEAHLRDLVRLARLDPDKIQQVAFALAQFGDASIEMLISVLDDPKLDILNRTVFALLVALEVNPIPFLSVILKCYRVDEPSISLNSISALGFRLFKSAMPDIIPALLAHADGMPALMKVVAQLAEPSHFPAICDFVQNNRDSEKVYFAISDSMHEIQHPDLVAFLQLMIQQSDHPMIPINAMLMLAQQGTSGREALAQLVNESPGGGLARQLLNHM